MFEFAIAGVFAPVFLLVLVGFTVGIVGGFIGVGGGYMVTPALIVFGFPGYMASGIDMTHIAGKGLVSTIRHRQLGNIDWTLALSMVAGTMLGVELGVRLLVYFKGLGISGIVLLITSVIVMFALFLYTQIETRRAHRRMEELTREGKELARELQTSSLPSLFQRIPLAPIIRCRTAHLVVSKASEHSPQSCAEARRLMRAFPNLEFVAGVNWARNLAATGPARWAEGYGAIEVGLKEPKDWADLPEALKCVRDRIGLL